MAGEIIEATVSESREAAISELASASHDHGHGGVAILLTVAAIVAATIGFRAAFISSSASESWQSALRTDVKRSAAAMNDVNYLYQIELPVAVRLLQARFEEAEMTAAAQGQTGATRQTLLLEASVQAQIVAALSPNSDLATKAEYALPSGGLDLGKRLAEIRALYPDLVALDPDGLQATGDRLAGKAELMMLALTPTSVGAFLGVLSQPFRRRRTLLLGLGGVALAGGVVMAVVVEVFA